MSDNRELLDRISELIEIYKDKPNERSATKTGMMVSTNGKFCECEHPESVPVQLEQRAEASAGKIRMLRKKDEEYCSCDDKTSGYVVADKTHERSSTQTKLLRAPETYTRNRVFKTETHYPSMNEIPEQSAEKVSMFHPPINKNVREPINFRDRSLLGVKDNEEKRKPEASGARIGVSASSNGRVDENRYVPKISSASKERENEEQYSQRAVRPLFVPKVRAINGNSRDVDEELSTGLRELHY